MKNDNISYYPDNISHYPDAASKFMLVVCTCGHLIAETAIWDMGRPRPVKTNAECCECNGVHDCHTPGHPKRGELVYSPGDNPNV